MLDQISPAPWDRSLLLRHPSRAADVIWWTAAIAVFFCFPNYLAFATTVVVTALFALSLGLIVGFAGIVTLGHAVFFGLGAYSAGLAAMAGWNEPMSGVLLGGLIAGVTGLILGPLVLRLAGLPLVMVTVGLGIIFYEAANKLSWLTGGDDGLSGITMAPLLGQFSWSMSGQTQYLYALGWLAIVFIFLRKLVAAPFGLTLEGIRENPTRMQLLGAPVLRQLVIAYAISATIAGFAGALSAQTTKFVGLAVFAPETSVDGLLIVVLGGLSSLYGALLGAPVYMVVRYFTQQWNPHIWMFVVGLLMIIIMRYGKGGLVAIVGHVPGLVGRLLRSLGVHE